MVVGRLLTDAVEKVGDGAPARNNRIASDDFLNRTCAFGGRLEPIFVQRTASKSFFNSIDPSRSYGDQFWCDAQQVSHVTVW